MVLEGASQRGGYCDLICAVCTGRRGIFTILIHLAGPILLIWLIYTVIKNIWK